MWLHVVLFLIFTNTCYALSTSCNANFCDPNWTPFDNMIAGLRGYNIRTGNPIQNDGDPGFKAQIFLPTKLNSLGRIELEPGITASELSYCKRTLTSESFTTMDSYRNYVAKTSSNGVNLQVGTETEVTAGVNLKGVDLSATKVIPKPFERAWGDSSDFKSLTKFFSEKQGLVSISMGTCTMYEMKLDRFHLPPFTVPFDKALIKLFKVRNSATYIRKSTFRLFIEEYGTHFLLNTKMGSEYAYRSKFSKHVRENFNAETLKKCTYVQGSKVFGIQVEEDKSGCTTTDKQKINALSSSDYEVSIITKGSRPTDVKHWATQDFTPVPLQFKLSPIVNLMSDELIKKANLKDSNGVTVSSLEIRKWFLPMYFDYCSSMNIGCGHKKGCGIDDNCPVDAICVPGGSKHECTQWSQWACTVDCGNGTQKKRTRRCTGCKGLTEQIANKRCAPQIECYNKNPQCKWQFTKWNRNGATMILYASLGAYPDIPRLDCGNDYTLNFFHLQRHGNHDNYRYRYKCCQTQLKCHTNNWARTGNYKVYLDRQIISCPHNQLLSGFEQRRHGGDYNYYDYRCCAMAQPKTCHDRYYPFSFDGDVSCPYGYGMNRLILLKWKWKWNGRHNQVRYHVRCCKINENGSSGKREDDEIYKTLIENVLDNILLKKK